MASRRFRQYSLSLTTAGGASAWGASASGEGAGTAAASFVADMAQPKARGLETHAQPEQQQFPSQRFLIQYARDSRGNEIRSRGSAPL